MHNCIYTNNDNNNSYFIFDPFHGYLLIRGTVVTAYVVTAVKLMQTILAHKWIII